jgi:cytidylate kinase
VAAQAVCISHSTGAGGEAVGRAVAERLGFRYVDDEVIEQAAEWSDLDPAFVADAERRRPLMARMLGHIAGQASPTRLPTGEAGRSLPTDADLRHVIGDALRSIADGGSVVIVAHAASFALTGPDILRVFVTASTETRVRRVAAERKLDERAATRQIREEDLARSDYLKRFYAVERELHTHFDVVLNTDVLPTERVVDVIVSLAA